MQFVAMDSPRNLCVFTYDANGNTLSDASGKSYAWDFENRMVSATVPGTGTVTFKYDPSDGEFKSLGRSVPQITSIVVPTYCKRSTTAATSSLGTRKGPTLMNCCPNCGPELRATMRRTALGSVTSLSNSAGVLANTYTYDSFGKLTASTGTIVNPFQYTAREFDQETGAYYYRARYYDQNLGRFISEDPLGINGGPNFYDYVSNDPVDLIDPPGLSPRPVPPYKWRNCTPLEESQCKSACAAQGKEFESCRVSQRYRIVGLKDGPVWADGPVSCSCKEPTPDKKPCPKTVPLIPIPIIIEILEGLAAAF